MKEEKTNKSFKLTPKEKAVLDVFMFARAGGFDPDDIIYIFFDGHNYKDCKEFLNGNYDNTIDYSNIMEKGAVREIKESDVILRYKDKYRRL